MHRLILLTGTAVLAALPIVHAQAPATTAAARPRPAAAEAAKLPVRRVVLFKNGVGYFEHLGRVRGTQSLAIDFNSAQLNDVLMSLTTLDLGGGRIGNAFFNSDAPLAEQLRRLSLPVNERTTRMELLDAVRGARVEVRTGERTIAGRILSVEQRTGGADKPPVDDLSVVTDAGEIRSVELTPAVSVKLLDRDLADQVGSYLNLISSGRSQDRRRMTITTSGTGERDVLVSYVSEVPVWKTTYRIVLPASGKPFLQGWAIVDNTIGEDWNGVELSLVAGAPQSFIQQLSQPQYTRRPVVEMSGSAQRAPQTQSETMTAGGPGLTGRVLDQTGTSIPGVTVTASMSGARATQATTDSSGRYQLSVPAGTYRLDFSLAGFKTSSIETATAGGSALTVHDVTLAVGEVSESINVIAQALAFDTRSTALSIAGRSGFPAASPAPPPPPRLDALSIE